MTSIAIHQQGIDFFRCRCYIKCWTLHNHVLIVFLDFESTKCSQYSTNVNQWVKTRSLEFTCFHFHIKHRRCISRGISQGVTLSTQSPRALCVFARSARPYSSITSQRYLRVLLRKFLIHRTAIGWTIVWPRSAIALRETSLMIFQSRKFYKIRLPYHWLESGSIQWYVLELLLPEKASVPPREERIQTDLSYMMSHVECLSNFMNFFSSVNVHINALQDHGTVSEYYY